MDITQIILASAVLILTVIISMVGVQVFLIFREVRHSIKKVNKVIEDAGIVSELAVRQLSSLNGIMGGVQTIASLINIFIKKENKEEYQPQIKEDDFLHDSNPSFSEPQPTLSSSLKRFFTKGGKKLS